MITYYMLVQARVREGGGDERQSYIATGAGGNHHHEFNSGLASLEDSDKILCG